MVYKSPKASLIEGGINAGITNPVVVNNNVIGGTFSRTDNSFTRVELVNDDNQDFDSVTNLGINAVGKYHPI